MAWLETCKIDFNKQIEHKTAEGMTKKDALKILSEEAGISQNTLKNWLYPKTQKKTTKKRKKGGKVPKTVLAGTPDPEPDSAESHEKSNDTEKVTKKKTKTRVEEVTETLPEQKGYKRSGLDLDQWYKDIDKSLEIAKDLIEGKIHTNDFAEGRNIDDGLGLIHKFVLFYVKKKKEKS